MKLVCEGAFLRVVSYWGVSPIGLGYVSLESHPSVSVKCGDERQGPEVASYRTSRIEQALKEGSLGFNTEKT